jgi:hypothetical protein
MGQKRKGRAKAKKRKKYKIVRHYQERGKRKRTIKSGLTEKEAKTHCKSEKSRGSGWFDGYTRESPPKKRRRRR